MRLEEALAILELDSDASLKQADKAFVRLLDGDVDRTQLELALKIVRSHLLSAGAPVARVSVRSTADLKTEVSPVENATVVSPPDDATVVASAQDATVVEPAQDANVVASEKGAPEKGPSEKVAPEQEATVVTPADDATVVMTAEDIAELAPNGNDVALSPAVTKKNPPPRRTVVKPSSSGAGSQDVGVDLDATVVGDVETIAVQEARRSASAGSRRLLVLVPIVLAIVGLVVYLVSPGEPELPAENVVDEVPDSTQLRVLGGRWLMAINQLQVRRDKLEFALEASNSDPASARRVLEIVDASVLERYRETLNVEFPSQNGLEAANRAYTELSNQLADAEQRVARIDRLPLVAVSETLGEEQVQQSGEGFATATEPGVEQTTDSQSYNEPLRELDEPMDDGYEEAFDPNSEDALTEFSGEVDPGAFASEGTGVALANTGAQTESDGKTLYMLGMEAVSRDRLTRPTDASAVYFLQQLRAQDPQGAQTDALEASIESRFIALADRYLGDGRTADAGNLIGRAQSYLGDSPQLTEQAQIIEQTAVSERAALLRMGDEVEEFPGIVVVPLPPGRFVMGTPGKRSVRDLGKGSGIFASLFGRDGSDGQYSLTVEQPAHRVEILPIVGLSRNEISVAQFAQFVDATAYEPDAVRRGSSQMLTGTGQEQAPRQSWRTNYLGGPADALDPVIHVSYNDAVAFTRWLSFKTKSRYRLPTETELEYAIQGGSGSLYPWGKGQPPGGYGNFRGSGDSRPAGWQELTGRDATQAVQGYTDAYHGPAPAGVFSRNAYGLENTLGNVSEWTQDCYIPNYAGKGGSQDPRTQQRCTDYVIRGTDWATDARLLRATWRRGAPADFTSNTVGFRVARELGDSR